MTKKLALILALVATAAFAGDEDQQQVSYTGTAACSTALSPSTRYAVQCTTDCYIKVSKATTGAGNLPTSTKSVLLTAGKLYDVYTTRTKVYICAIQSSASGSAKIFTYQDGSND